MATMSPSAEDRSKIDGKQLEMLRVRNQHGKSVGLTEDLRQRK